MSLLSRDLLSLVPLTHNKGKIIAKRRGHGNPGSAAPQKFPGWYTLASKPRSWRGDIILFQALCSLAL